MMIGSAGKVTGNSLTAGAVMPHECRAFQINRNTTVRSSFSLTTTKRLYTKWCFRKWISRWLVGFLHKGTRPAMQKALLYHSVICYMRWGRLQRLHLLWLDYINVTYRKTSSISRTLVGNIIVHHSDVVGASPVGAAPTTFSFSTWHLASRDSAKTAAGQYENLPSVGIWCDLY